MLTVNNLSYYLGSRVIYENASLHIKPKDKIGLIGLNGTGKSTLLRLIVREYQPDAGDIAMSKECTIGFLNQDLLSFISDESILSVVMGAFSEAMLIQKKIEEATKKMETDYSDELMDEFAKLQERFEALEGYTIQAKAEEILEGVGFRTEDLARPLKEFSGGWRMRVMLAKLLLEKPSLLLLDEPTNHLDLPTIQWIENYLMGYEGAYVIVSHDRQFLDNSVTQIVEVTGGQLHQYAGNYSFYLEEKELRNEIQRNAFANQQQKIKQTEQFINRFRAQATKARQVQSKIKSLDRMEMIDDVINDSASVNFKFKFKQKSGRFVSILEKVSKAYGDLKILENTPATIERGDKIALIGANGKGKSTILRILGGAEQHTGKVQIGHNVNTGFFAQHQLESLTVENEILDELKQMGTENTETELRAVLGCFLFRGDDVFKKIKVLSGGEKSRVALAKTLIGEANFLLLDEPTNHLDMQSVNILIQALQQYEGTFVVVSHDRHFVKNIATKIWWIEDHQIKEYPGTYDEYVWWKQQQEEASTAPIVKNKSEKSSKKDNWKDQNQKDRSRELKKLKTDLEVIEIEIEKAEEHKTKIEDKLADPKIFQDADKLKDFNQQYDKVKSALTDLNSKWESTAEKIEEVEG